MKKILMVGKMERCKCGCGAYKIELKTNGAIIEIVSMDREGAILEADTASNLPL